MNKIVAAAFVLLATAGASHAEDVKPIRVIPITREAAEQSATVLAAAKNPTIGVPPQGQPQSQQALTRVSAKSEQGGRAAGNDRFKEARNVEQRNMREARAEAVVTPAPEYSSPTRAVNVISPTAFGRLAVQVFEVSSRP
jgi:hypothetical protein